MACIKGIIRLALAPDAPYMAAGTMAVAVDLSFSSSANLEIFMLDFQSDDHDLLVVGESPRSERFNRLTWAKNGSGSEDFSLWLVASGLVNGSIDIWNALTLIRSRETVGNPLVAHLSRHYGPVRGLEFNSFTPNLLAADPSWARIAALVPVVVSCAETGDEVANKILQDSVEELALSVKAVVQRLGLSGEDGKRSFPLVMVAGVLKANKRWDIGREVIKCISRDYPGAIPIRPKMEPAVGAALLAGIKYDINER